MESSSSSSPRPYEVFLSFRGEDTRNNFVSHLHAALHGRGIRTYFDETNLQKGQTIGPELVKAIEESSIAIVVLSTNYASSTWCLNELLKIMDCNNKSGLSVFPIFYHVDPSDVRWQENSFFEAFAVHEVNFKEDVFKIKSWRKSLKQVADLAGEYINRGKNEASCIKKIADKILRLLPEKASQFRKSLVGIESRISEIKELIYSKPGEVLFIGLWGMGGIGKTTTARAIFEDCKQDFDGSCFLQDVKESKNRMHNLQKTLLSDVLKVEFEGIHDVVRGSSMIQERFRFKKVMLVIDDVDDIEQLNALAGQCDWFGSGSRIIITTRDEHLIIGDHIEKYDVQTLLENEALHLFCLHAFNNDHPPEEFKELSLKVLRYVGGLPLALQVLGHHLYQREKYVWKSTLSRLKNVPEEKITSILQISFDGLNVLQQNMFLHIACFFRGYCILSVEERLHSLGLDYNEGIDVLVEKSLIHISINYINNYNYNFNESGYFHLDNHDESGPYDVRQGYHIEMHDLLQEMGWYIIRQRSNWDVRRYSHLWLKRDLVDLLSDITVSSEVEWMCMGKMISNPYHLDDDEVNNLKLGWEGAFKDMSKLSFLELSGDFFEGNYDVNVSHSFSHLDKKLRAFYWNQYPGYFLPKSFHPMNLVYLVMRGSQIKETPDFSHMPNLEVLNLCSSHLLVHVHPSLGNHMKMKHINLECCDRLKEFPKINYPMKSLEFLNLSHTDLKTFPEICGNLDSLRILKLKGTYINGLPMSMEGNANGLQKLVLVCNNWFPYEEEFTSLKVVEESFPGLISLEITGNRIVRTLNFSHLPYLEELNLSNSQELIEVHKSLGVHKRIKSINLSHCSKLQEFPRIISMNSLEELDLSSTNLQSFPEITGNVNRLRKLYLDKTMITTLPWSIGRAANLEIISMTDCKYLFTLPLSCLGHRFRRIYISSETLKYFQGDYYCDEAAVQQEVELLFSKGMGMGGHYGARISFRGCQSLEELPKALISRVEFLGIMDCPTLTSWICFNLVDLLDEYQNLRYLQLHERYDIFPPKFLQAFSEWESMSCMLREREEYFKVCFPGRQIPSWFNYKISRRSVTMFLPPLSDKLRGFVLTGRDVFSAKNFGLTTFDDWDVFDYCLCPEDSHVLVMYVPIDTISGHLKDWDGQNECTLFELVSLREMEGTTPRWGLSLVYNVGEVNEVDPYQVTIMVTDEAFEVDPCQAMSESDYWPDHATFRVKIAPNRDMIEKLYSSNNPISWALFEQQKHLLQAGTLAMTWNLFHLAALLSSFPSGPDLTCYQEGEPRELDESIHLHVLILS